MNRLSHENHLRLVKAAIALETRAEGFRMDISRNCTHPSNISKKQRSGSLCDISLRCRPAAVLTFVAPAYSVLLPWSCLPGDLAVFHCTSSENLANESSAISDKSHSLSAYLSWQFGGPDDLGIYALYT